jgi:hypothetical protein
MIQQPAPFTPALHAQSQKTMHLSNVPDARVVALRATPLNLAPKHHFKANAHSSALLAVEFSSKVKTCMYDEANVLNRYDQTAHPKHTWLQYHNKNYLKPGWGATKDSLNY